VLAHLRDEVDAASSSGIPVVVAYLGDNIYEVGAREDSMEQDLPKLRAQVEPLGTRPNVRGVFVPGNHDWARGAPAVVGRTAVRIQREWLDRLAGGRDVTMRPDDGCPGPATADLGDSAHLVYIDTEWLLREPSDACGGADDFYERLADDLERTRDRPVVVMSHHPMATGGAHGGNVAPLHRGPLVYYLASRAGVSIQDLASGAYSAMIERLRGAFERSGNPPLVFASGHDHNLQVIRLGGPGQPTYQLVSGAGAKAGNVRRIDGTRYATNRNGYMRLDFGAAGVRLVVYAQIGGPTARVQTVFSCSLSSTSDERDCPEARLVGRAP
jgi:hypothetical protein